MCAPSITVFPLALVRAALRVTMRDHRAGNKGPVVCVRTSPRYGRPALHFCTSARSLDMTTATELAALRAELARAQRAFQ